MSKLLKDEASIITWLDTYNIKKYTLVPDAQYGFVVDVDGDVCLSHSNMEFIEVKFNRVSLDFYCHYNKLTNLEGAPISVGDTFDCSYNQIKSLEYCPSEVGRNFICDGNFVTSLEYCPTNIPEYFSCSENELVSLRGGPIAVGLSFDCSNNKLNNLEHCPISVGANFNCSFNKLTTLEYTPDKVAGTFDCYGNKKLDVYQNITDFAELRAKIISDKEKALLSKSINASMINTILKV